MRSLLHLVKHTEIYIPFSPYLVPILTSSLMPSTRPKSSTLRPLDFETQIRVPQQYVKTRVLSEGLIEETAYLLVEWLASASVHGSIAFPEIIVPIVVLIRKSLKNPKAGSGKDQSLVKVLLERIDESARWMEQRRKTVHFSPGKISDVQEWEKTLKTKLDDTPLGKYLKIQNKARDKRRQLVEKVSCNIEFCGVYLLVLFERKTDSLVCVGRPGLEKTRFWKIDIDYKLSIGQNMWRLSFPGCFASSHPGRRPLLYSFSYLL